MDAFAGHVAQKIEAAELGIELGEKRADLVGLSHVAARGHRATSPCTYSFGRVLRAGEVQVHQQQIGAGFRQSERHRLA